jgi:hypothetical protein
MSNKPVLRVLNVPEDYAGLACQPLPGGDVRVHLCQRGESQGFFECSAPDLASVATLVLHFAHDLHIQAGNKPTDEMPPLISRVLQANRFGLAPHEHPECETLIVQIGEAVMGFAIHNSQMTPLGTALLAAAAPPGKPN